MIVMTAYIYDCTMLTSASTFHDYHVLYDIDSKSLVT